MLQQHAHCALKKKKVASAQFGRESKIKAGEFPAACEAREASLVCCELKEENFS